MKTSKTISIITLNVIILLAGFSVVGQNSTSNWKISPANAKVFIENKGQFNNDAIDGQVLYAYDNGSTVVYFSKSGSTYAFIKKWPKEKNENEVNEKVSTPEEWKKKEAEEREMNFQTDFTGFTWENANTNVQIIASEPCIDYYSYSIKDNSGKVNNTNYIKAFKKLTYVNLYPNIDVEYTFHPVSGIKYALILHPGADVSKVKMKYTENPTMTEDGSLHFQTLFGDIVEHAPQSFYLDNPLSMVGSQFRTSGQIVSFELSPYDPAQTIVIDPWVQTPTLPDCNGVWECERDGNNNVYIIGGDSPLKLLKYNSAGALQWTYVTPWDTTTAWLGTMATDLAGNTYVTNGSVAELEKINTSGGMSYHVDGESMDEYWNLSFNSDQTKLFIGGTRLELPVQNSHGVIFDINTSNGSVDTLQNVGGIVNFTVLGMPITDPNEVRSITAAPNGRYYYLTLDTLGSIDENIGNCGDIFKLSHTYSFGYKCETYRPNNGNSGIMAIRAGQDFLYTQNGTTIHKRSLSTGAILLSATIPGGASDTVPSMTPTAYQVENSGLAIDNCGNVYAGSSTGVVKYDADLNMITNYNTPYKVFDVAVNGSGNIIICGATGDNSQTTPRTGYIESVNMTACTPMPLINCNANICTVAPVCYTDPAFTLTPSLPGGTWSGTGITNAVNGLFDPSIAGAGTHTIYYTMACGMDSTTIVVNACIPLYICQELNGNLSVSGGTGPYTWSVWVDSAIINIVDATTCTDCGGTWFFSSCLSGTTPITSCTIPGHWSVFATGTTVTPPGFPIQVVDTGSSLGSVIDSSLLLACGACPPVIVSQSSVINASCNGLSDGSFKVSASGGANPYDFILWVSGAPIDTILNASGQQSFSGLPAGVYTIKVKDANDCPGNINVTINEPAAISPTITGILNFNFGDSSVLDAGAGYTSYLWSSSDTSQTITVYTGGTYSVTVSDSNGCLDTAMVIVTVSDGINSSLLNQPFVFYPNPTEDNLILEIAQITVLQNNLVSILDVQGKLILQKKIKQIKTEINTSILAKGLYFLKFENENIIIVRKFVKE
jgi:hypothetical protein